MCQIGHGKESTDYVLKRKDRFALATRVSLAPGRLLADPRKNNNEGYSKKRGSQKEVAQEKGKSSRERFEERAAPPSKDPNGAHRRKKS